MNDLLKFSAQAGYRMLDRDWIDDRELYSEPDPSRLRAACLMIYAGLLLSLGAILGAGPAAAHALDFPVIQTSSVQGSIEHDARVLVRSGALNRPSRLDGRKVRFLLVEYRRPAGSRPVAGRAISELRRAPWSFANSRLELPDTAVLRRMVSSFGV